MNYYNKTIKERTNQKLENQDVGELVSEIYTKIEDYINNAREEFKEVISRDNLSIKKTRMYNYFKWKRGMS